MSTTQRWDHHCDLLVIGSGAGGMITATIARDLGLEPLIVEKSDLYGGCSAISGGNVWIPCNHLMASAGIDDSPEEAITYLRSVTRNHCADKLKNYVDTGAPLIKYLENHSPVQFSASPLPDYYSCLPGGKHSCRALEPLPLSRIKSNVAIGKLRPAHPQTSVAGVSYTTAEIARILRKEKGWLRTAAQPFLSQYLDPRWYSHRHLPKRLTLGHALAARCHLALRERDVPLWTQTAFCSLIDNGEQIQGAVVSKDGAKLRIKAKRGVVLASGGFSHNPVLRARHLPYSSQTRYSVAPVEHMGDGHIAGIQAGADTDLMDEAWWIPVYQMPGAQLTCGMFMERSFPGSIIVNRQGQRFLNEAADYDTAGRNMISAIAEGTGDMLSYFIFDRRFRQRYPAGPLLPMPAVFDSFLNRDKRKLIVKAKSLEQLATKLAIDQVGLSRTIARYNRLASTGVDTDYGRGNEPYERHYSDSKCTPNSTMAPIETPPYYAIPICPGDIGTRGGLITDDDGRVLRTGGRAIKGLFAIGSTSASVMGQSYPGGGATLGPAIVFGARAAAAAAGANLLAFLDKRS